MFDPADAGHAGHAGPAGARAGAGRPGATLATAELADWVDRLRDLDSSVADAERVDQLHLLERLKSATAAAQARVTAAFAASQRETLEAAGVPKAKQGRTIGAQVALARRLSPHQGSRHVGLADALVHEMPRTLAALESGATNEWRATLIVRETACLTRHDRTAVDSELSALPGGLAALGDRQSADEARKIAYRLDPGAAVLRQRRAEAERRVTIRPTPDTMTSLTGLLPVTHGVAAFAALDREARSVKARGDGRTKSQIMADLFVERLTGQPAGRGYDPARWDATPPPPPPSPERGLPRGTTVELQLVMTDRALFGGDETPAHLQGHGPLPAFLARRLVATASAETAVWLRRLYTDPETGALVGMESRARTFPEQLGRFIEVRDQVCRMPWCNAPIRHHDHVRSVREGGGTTAANGQGLCEGCNYLKEAPGWTARPDPDPGAGAGARVVTTTPTRHSYSTAPPPPVGGPGGRAVGRMERAFAALLAA